MTDIEADDPPLIDNDPVPPADPDTDEEKP